MPIPGFQDLMLPVLREVASVEEMNTAELVRRMADAFRLTTEERAELLPSGRQTVIANRTHWAVAYLSKTKLLERTRRAHYRLTARGRAAIASPLERIDLKYLSQFAELAEFRGERGAAIEQAAPSSGEITPDEAARAAFAQIDAALRQELLQRILGAKPAFFEKLVVDLLVAMGFGRGLKDPGRVAGKSGDGGIDGVIDQDGLGLDRVYIQAKRYGSENTVGSGAIQQFFGSLAGERASKGVFITTSTFTKAARDVAAKLPTRIVLIDGDQLATLLIRHDVGVRIEQTFHIKRIDEDAFAEEA